MKKSIWVLGAYFLLAACSTTIKTSQEIPPQIRQDIVVREVSVQIADGAVVPADIPTRLQQAVLQRAAERGKGTTPAALKITITQFNVVSIAGRFFGGPFGGSNKLDVAVDVAAPDGTILGHYTVEREANPGGYGIYFDQTQSTINDTANGVMDGLYDPR